MLLSSILLQAAAGASLGKLGAAIGAAIAVIGAASRRRNARHPSPGRRTPLI